MEYQAQMAPEEARCDCGKPAVSLCGTGGDYPTVVHCRRPVCRGRGHWCRRHRHAPGTMTYGFVAAEVRFEFERFVADGGGPWDSVVAAFWNLLPLRWRLRRAFRALEASHPPPSPLPRLIVLYRGRRFVDSDGQIAEDKPCVPVPADCPGQFGDVPGACGLCGGSFEKHNQEGLIEPPEWARE